MASWFSKMLEAAKGAVVKEGEDYVLHALTASQGVPEKQEALERDMDYVTIDVRSSRIVNIQKWTGKFYASVQSRVHYLHEGKGEVEYQQVIVPQMSALDVKNVDRFVVVDKPLVGPVPYRGRLSLELGLFSVKGGDLAGPYLDLLSEVAKVSGVAILGQAMPFVEPLRKGANLLFGNNEQSTLEVGLDKTWEDMQTGTWVLIRGPKGKVEVASLRLDAKDGRITDAKGMPYKDYPYLVFRISRSRQRDDWMLIPELKEAWNAIGEALKAGKVAEAEARFSHFQVVARWSPDLVPADALRLTAIAKSKMGLLQTTPGIALAAADIAPFPQFADLGLYAK